MEVLTSPLALAYFLEFLETKDLKYLVDFWLAVQAFKVVALERSHLSSNDLMKRKQTLVRNEDMKSERVPEISMGKGQCKNIQLGWNSSYKQNNKKPFVNDFSPSFESQAHQMSKDTNEIDANGHKRSMNTFRCTAENDLSGINFSGKWQPFSNEDENLQERVSKPDERQAKRDSYVARRIMSKQTRNRTKSMLFCFLHVKRADF